MRYWMEGRGKLSDFTGNLTVVFRRKTITKMHAKTELLKTAVWKFPLWIQYPLRSSDYMRYTVLLSYVKARR